MIARGRSGGQLAVEGIHLVGSRWLSRQKSGFKSQGAEASWSTYPTSPPALTLPLPVASPLHGSFHSIRLLSMEASNLGQESELFKCSSKSK